MANMNTQKSTQVLTTPTAAKRAACDTSATSGVPARSGRARRISGSRRVMDGRLARSTGGAEPGRRAGAATAGLHDRGVALHYGGYGVAWPVGAARVPLRPQRGQ